MRVAVYGAGGRMGAAVIRCLKDEGIDLVGAIDRRGSALVGRDAGEASGAGTLGVAISEDVAAGLLGADLVIDFSHKNAIDELLVAARRAKVALVSGTTGLEPASERALDELAELVPTLWAPNMSLGVHVLATLVRQAAAALGPAFSIDIVETHHGRKVDAPSGTALRLFEAAKDSRPNSTMTTGREGQVGQKPVEEIGVLAVRGGDVIGDHTVHFLGPAERLELTHRATSRDLFARGAVAMAKAIVTKKPGRYTLAQIVDEQLGEG